MTINEEIYSLNDLTVLDIDNVLSYENPNLKDMTLKQIQIDMSYIGSICIYKIQARYE